MPHSVRPDTPCECAVCEARLHAYTREARAARQNVELWVERGRTLRSTLTSIVEHAREGASRADMAGLAARRLGWDAAALSALAAELAPAPASAFEIACARTRRLFEAEDTGAEIELTSDTRCECCGETAGPGRRALGLTGCLSCWDDGSMTSVIEV